MCNEARDTRAVCTLLGTTKEGWSDRWGSMHLKVLDGLSAVHLNHQCLVQAGSAHVKDSRLIHLLYEAQSSHQLTGHNPNLVALRPKSQWLYSSARKNCIQQEGGNKCKIRLDFTRNAPMLNSDADLPS